MCSTDSSPARASQQFNTILLAPPARLDEAGISVIRLQVYDAQKILHELGSLFFGIARQSVLLATRWPLVPPSMITCRWATQLGRKQWTTRNLMLTAAAALLFSLAHPKLTPQRRKNQCHRPIAAHLRCVSALPFSLGHAQLGQ